MQIQVAARIQGHPARRHLHGSLADSLGLPVEVSEHSSDPPSPWDGYRRALSDPPGASHLLVIQDDAVVCGNFGLAVEQIAAANPNTPVCLFLANLPKATAAAALKAGKAGQHYADVFWRDFCPVVAMLWPREKALQFLEWSEHAKLPGHRGRVASDDAVVGEWMRKSRPRERIRCTVPSLVQHLADEPTVKGAANASSSFRALMLAEDGLQYDWS